MCAAGVSIRSVPVQPQEITAFAACLAVLVSLISLAATAKSTANTAQSLVDAEERAEEQARPIVVAELQRHSNSEGTYLQGIQDLVLTNYGSTPARNLRATFTPAIPDPTPADQAAATLTSSLVRRFAMVHTLAPGAEKRNVYVLGEAGPDGRYVNKEPTPARVTVAVVYENMAGREYRDEFALDVDDIGLSTFSRPVPRR